MSLVISLSTLFKGLVIFLHCVERYNTSVLIHDLRRHLQLKWQPKLLKLAHLNNKVQCLPWSSDVKVLISSEWANLGWNYSFFPALFQACVKDYSRISCHMFSLFTSTLYSTSSVNLSLIGYITDHYVHYACPHVCDLNPRPLLHLYGLVCNSTCCLPSTSCNYIASSIDWELPHLGGWCYEKSCFWQYYLISLSPDNWR